MMTFLLFAPASTKWLGWRKDRNPEGTLRFVTFIVQSYFNTLLRYAGTFCGAVVLKVMDQKTLVKSRWGYKVRLLCMITLGEFARHEFTNLWFILETLPDTLSLSLTGILPQTSTDDYRNSPTIKFCANLFPVQRRPSVIKFQIRLECASVNRPNVLLISKAYFSANKMNWM